MEGHGITGICRRIQLQQDLVCIPFGPNNVENLILMLNDVIIFKEIILSTSS